MSDVLAALPSPSSGELRVGGVAIRAYGAAIALGIGCAIWLAQRRWSGRGGDPDHVTGVALWAVGAGVAGARAYHVATDWTRFDGRFLEVFAIWKGGLGIPGGLIAGISTGAFVAYRRGLPLARFVDAVLPGIPLGQAIGRWGNWFNQELFGRPTQLAWALEIDPAHRPAQLARFATFHPTFLYESLWCAALVLALICLDQRELLRRGHLIGAYLVGYALGRLWIESLRVDPASRLLGMRVNMWSMSTALLIGLIICAAGLRRPAPHPATAVLEREL